MANPFDQFDQGPVQPRQGTIIRDPYRAREEERKDTATALEAERLRVSQAAEARQREQANKAPDGYRWTNGPGSELAIVPGGPADPAVIAAAKGASADALTAEQKGAARSQYNNLINLADGVTKLRKQYDESFKGRSAKEYLPGFARPENAVFNSTSGGLNAFIATALGLTGQQFNTPAEQQLFIGSILPKASDPDEVIESKLNNLDSLISNARVRGRDLLGYTDETDPLLKSETFRNYINAGHKPPSGVSGPTPQSILSPNAKVSTDEEKKIAAAINEALKAGGSQEALNALSQSLTGQPLNDFANEQLGKYFRNEGPMPTFVPTQTGDPSAIQGAVTGAAQTAPGAALGSYANAALGGIPQLVSGDAPFEAMRDGSPKSSFAGDVLGGVTGTLAPAAGLMKAGVAAPRAAMAANLAYGTLFGANTDEDNRLAGAGLGAGAALAGDALGRFAIAPLATKIMDTKPAQAAASKATGMFGRGPVAVPRKMDAADSIVADAASPRLTDIMAQLDEAQRLGLPFSLADADAGLRQTLGSASRLSPDVRTSIGAQLQDRSLAQADRAIAGIGSDLTAPVSMSAESDAIRKAAQDAAEPFYSRAYGQPAITTPELEGLLRRPSLRDAMGRANRIISEEGGSAQQLGFGLDSSGAPILNPIPANELAGLGKAHADFAAAQDALKRANASLAPGNVSQLQRAVDEAGARLEAAKAAMDGAPSVDSLSTMPAYNWKALDYAKRGLDDVVEQFRDPITRRLNLDEGGRAVDRTRAQYRTALGNLNDDYRQGLDAYSDVIRGRDALNNGYSVAAPNTNMDEFGQALTAIQPHDMDRFRQGFSTSMADRINKARLSGNPYDIVAGTPDQQAKISGLFPGATNFLRRRELERQMAETAREVLGGSPTAERLASDSRFMSDATSRLGDAAEIGMGLATGMPPIGVATRAATGGLKGMFGRRAQLKSEEQAKKVAPFLFNQNPTSAASELQALIDDIMARRAYQSTIKSGAGVIAGGATAGAFGGY